MLNVSDETVFLWLYWSSAVNNYKFTLEYYFIAKCLCITYNKSSDFILPLIR